MTDDLTQFIRNNNWDTKSPKVRMVVPDIYEIYKEGNNLINMRQFDKYLTINTMSLESCDTPDYQFFYGAKDIGISIVKVLKVLSVF